MLLLVETSCHKDNKGNHNVRFGVHAAVVILRSVENKLMVKRTINHVYLLNLIKQAKNTVSF